jgi:hypothetical protein
MGAHNYQMTYAYLLVAKVKDQSKHGSGLPLPTRHKKRS